MKVSVTETPFTQDKFLNEKNLHESTFCLNETGETAQLFERQTVLQSVTEFARPEFWSNNTPLNNVTSQI